MKKILTLAFFLTIAFGIQAQLKTPKPSPLGKFEQKVGLTDVTVEYSRPGMKGRTIFGDLVPYDKLWRTGANKNTMITFSDDVMVSGKELKAGSYAIFTKPNAKSWEIIFYTDTKNWGTPREWDDSKVAATVTADVMKMPMKMETFTMLLDDLSNDAATLGFLWEDVYVGVKIDFPTAKKVSKNIEKVMSGPAANDYYAAASYMLESDGDINTALTYIDKAIEMTKDKPRFWYLRKQSLIHAKAGKKETAIAAAKASLKAAEEAKNEGYIKMNKASLKEWGAM